jgi:hypothetical protein
MAVRAQALGLTMDPTIAAQYGTMPAKFALDAIQETWTPVYGPQHLRPIVGNSTLSNSVALRVKYALTYTPGNLALDEGELGDGYSLLQIVNETVF